jgi:Holliday junction resolvase RusA-like endonuclease
VAKKGTRIGVGSGNTQERKKNAALYKRNMALQERTARQHRALSMHNPITFPLLFPKKKTAGIDGRRNQKKTHRRLPS